MLTRTALATLVVLLPAAIQAARPAVKPAAKGSIPGRPEQLRFKPMSFNVPKAKDHRVTLSNGITVHLVPDPKGQPLVSFNLLVKGGSHLELPGKEGSAFLVGNLLRSGGTEALDADKLDERLDFLAAEARTNMTDTELILGMNLLAKDAKEGADLLLTLLTRPVFRQDRLDLARRNRRQAMERRNDETSSIERYQLGLLATGEDHYTNRFVTAASLDSITREDLLELHGRLMHPGNMSLAVSGRFDREEMVRLLEATFGALKPGPKAVISPRPPAPRHEIQPGIYITEKDVNQGRVSLLLPGLRKTDPDWYAVEVMNFILGGDFTSRLTNRIRTENGLSYSVGSYFSEGPFYTGIFQASFQTKVRTVAFGIRLTLAELAAMRDKPVTDAELAMAKGAIIDGFPAEFANKAAVASMFNFMEYRGIPEDFLETYRDKIRAVTPADIQRVARKYLQPERLAILVVGGKAADLEEGDVKDHPGKLSEVAPLKVRMLPMRDPLTMKPLK